MIVVSAPKL